ncbi:import receptor subunit tom40 [Anaeramoeba flamelloides]|uniref:Import receptor subunit tom40 n=1 Tax=Anaeramoeba flamelloides TaxID=1746091 RepID=A0AAV7Z5H6_9EUKA|nr:import receptor subunit tom40 [Anaeramoeba flamelloides]KAJ6247817.1 import receptor subunit tom40 [Anaeramoeba flamelloides]|eukprot:Anaeramoba_flamelloidesc40122_g1_i1.p1 GENE.c40122_g1_i1~~c40122_g1_i1.p1  ORF type:complete len:296 (-),score=42.40 c40122_g1_i1:85-972(-)
MGQALPNPEKNLPTTIQSFPVQNLNPGKFDNYSQEANSILDIKAFDGFVLELNHHLNKQFSLGHSLTMGSYRKPPSYSIQTSYNNNSMSLVGNMDMNGFLRGNFLARLSQRMFVQSSFNVSKRESNSNGVINAEYMGKDWTGRMEYQSTKTFTSSYYQRLTKKLSVGLRLTYFNPNKASSIMLMGRHVGEKSISTFTYSDFLKYISLSYVHKITPRIGFGTEFYFNLANYSSFTSLGFKYSLRNAIFQSRLTSTGQLETCVSLAFPIVTLGFSVTMDYLNDKYSAGIKVHLGPRD